MAFETIQKNSTPQMVAEQIVKKVNQGELNPGDLLPSQRELAELFGVGRSSVREAVNALSVMGYLEAIQGKGTFIKEELPAEDVSMIKLNAAFQAGSIFDLMEAREFLECKSVELATERADQNQIRTLKAILEEMKKTHYHYDKFLNADMKLHKKIAETTGNPVIGEMTKLVLKKVYDHHAKLPTRRLSDIYLKESIHTAKQVVAFIENREKEKAATWMKIHLNAIKDELKDLLIDEGAIR